jgi:ligand-binding SRPBCC domain-containing protein
VSAEPRTTTLVFRSRLDASADAVWTHATSMRGVNRELAPWLRMTYPAGFDDLARVALAEGGEVPTKLFVSWILAFRVIPAERWDLGLAELGPGRRFVERSNVLTLSSWRHERSVEPVDVGASALTDRLTFAPRIALVAPLVVRLVSALFGHRHRWLRRRFGGEPLDG